MRDWKKERNDECNRNGTEKMNQNLLQSVRSFIDNRTKGKKVLSPGCTTNLMAHLTYFGYCFNPISIFYCLRQEKKSKDMNISNKFNDIKKATRSDCVPMTEKEILKSDITATKASTGTETESSIESIIVEVSNTPWIEQHSYMLDEAVENVS